MDHSGSKPRSQALGESGVLRPYKQSRTGIMDQQKRREVFLARQRAARHDFQAHARRLAGEATRHCHKERPVGIDGQDQPTAVGREEPTMDGVDNSPASAAENPGKPWTREAPSARTQQTSELDMRVWEDGGSQPPNTSLWTATAPSTHTLRSTDGINGGTGAVPKCVDPSSLSAASGPEPSGDGAMDMGEGSRRSEWESSDDEGGVERALSGKGAQEWYAKQLMTPEWMVDIPPHLGSDWLVLARPEGRRCLVISSNGTTVARLRNGRVLHRFPSLLPNGARTKQVAAAASIYCILDCVFHEPDSTFYILDIMAWKGYAFYNCAAEFRLYWLRNALEESGVLEAAPSHFHRFRFSTVTAHKCTEEGLHGAYHGAVPYRRDGLLFFNKYSHYALGLTPLVLSWKDAACSQYVLDTDAQGKVPEQQQVVLEYRADGTVATADTPPVVFGTLPQAFVQNNSKHLRPGLLLKFSMGPQGLGFVDGRLSKADIRYEGPGNQRRGGADSFSKVGKCTAY